MKICNLSIVSLNKIISKFNVLVTSTFLIGCVSTQIIPNDEQIRSIHNIVIIPIESPPLLLPPNALDNKPTGDLIRASLPMTSIPIHSVQTTGRIIIVLSGAVLLLEAAMSGKEIPGETAKLVKNQNFEVWLPTLQFAKSAKSILTATGYNESIVVDEFTQLPVTDRSTTWHMENWLAPIRRWYNKKKSTLNYQDVVTKDTDALLEIGLLNYEYYPYLNHNDYRMIMQIMVKLIDPKTKKVIGRARGSENYIKVGSLTDALQNNAEKHKQITEEIGKKLVEQCLVDLGLITKK